MALISLQSLRSTHCPPQTSVGLAWTVDSFDHLALWIKLFNLNAAAAAQAFRVYGNCIHAGPRTNFHSRLQGLRVYEVHN